jgi:hypothetical protein
MGINQKRMSSIITIKTADAWQGRPQPTVILQIAGVNVGITAQQAMNLIQNLEAAVERVCPDEVAEQTVI